MIQHRFKKVARPFFDRFIKSKVTPREIAMGFSLGILIGMTPFLGTHVIACVLLASILGCSKIAAIAGINITNVITAPLIYPINYWVGAKLVGTSNGVDWSTIFDYATMIMLIEQSPLILVDLFIGGLVIGIPLAVAGYFSVLRIARLYIGATSPA